MIRFSLSTALRSFCCIAFISVLVSVVLVWIESAKGSKNAKPQAYYHKPKPIIIPEKYLENIPNISRHDYGYIINPLNGQLCNISLVEGRAKPSSRLLILFMVHSAADHFEHRRAIRETWGSFGKRLSKLVFLLGDPQNTTLQKLLFEEAREHNDIVQEDFYETYRNITLKNISGLKWAVTFCTRAEYVVKADDDMFVNTPLLIQSLITSSMPKRRLILCKIHFFKKVPREGKYGISSEIYGPNSWPDFCFGGCWITSRDVVQSFYNISLQTRQIYLDDVYVTGILRIKLGLDLNYLSRAYNMFCHARGNYTKVREMWEFQRNKENRNKHYIQTWSSCFQ